MRYAQIRKMDISNGKGIGVSLFVQGCDFHCKGCFNTETWNFEQGKNFTNETINTILDLCSPEYITHLSVLGGEPFHSNNYDSVMQLCHAFKQKHPYKTVWVWTGYNLDELLQSYQFKHDIQKRLQCIDYIIAGRFIKDLYYPDLLFRGSLNQRIYKRISDNNISSEQYITFRDDTNKFDLSITK